MSVRSILISVGLFLGLVVLLFPYDALARRALVRLVPGFACEKLEAAPWSGVRIYTARVRLSDRQTGVFNEVRLAPTGIFPLKGKLEIIKGELQGDPAARPTWALFAGSALEELKVELIYKKTSLEFPAISVKTDLVQFDGSGSLAPSFPPKSASLQLKGQAVIGGRTLPIDKSFPLADFLSP